MDYRIIQQVRLSAGDHIKAAKNKSKHLPAEILHMPLVVYYKEVDSTTLFLSLASNPWGYYYINY
jgi:hypothetical protein